jgi:hypothetical protein
MEFGTSVRRNEAEEQLPALVKGGLAAPIKKCCEASEALQTGAERKRDSAQALRTGWFQVVE